MKIALLVPFTNTNTNEKGYYWETPSEKALSKDYSTKDEALKNRPAGYSHRDDGYHTI